MLDATESFPKQRLQQFQRRYFPVPVVLKRIRELSNSALMHQGLRRYLGNTSWLLGEQVLRMVVGLLVGIWVARYLGPEQYGLLSYSIAFVALFGSLSKLGLDSIVVRDLVRMPDQRDQYLGTAFWLKVSGAFVMLAVMALATRFTSNDATTNLYIFIIASGTLFQACEVVDFYFQSKVLSKFVSICKLTQLVISSLIKVFLIVVHADLIWFVLVSLADQITLALSFLIAYRHQNIGGFFRHFNRSLAVNLLRDSWPLIFSGLVIMVYMRIDQLMIKELLGERQVGLYSAAVRLSEVWYFIPAIITTSIFPAIINAKKVSEELYHTRLKRLYSLMFWSAFGIALPLTLLSNWLVILLYGQAYGEAGQALEINIWAGIFVFLGVASGKWYLNENLQKYSMANATMGAISNVILNLFLIPKYGINGAAFSTLISYAISAYFMNAIFSKTRPNFMRMTKSIFVYK